jgi:hypothetical protein
LTVDLVFRQATAADLPAMLRLLVDDAVAQARGGYGAEVTPEVAAAFAPTCAATASASR